MKKLASKVKQRFEEMTMTEAVLLGVSLGLLAVNIRTTIVGNRIKKDYSGLLKAYHKADKEFTHFWNEKYLPTHVMIKDVEIQKILDGTPHRFNFPDGVVLFLTKLTEGE